MSNAKENFEHPEPSFADTLREVLEVGAGKQQQGTPWTIKGFAEKIHVSDRIVRYWVSGHSVPRSRAVDDMIIALGLSSAVAKRLKAAQQRSQGVKERGDRESGRLFPPTWRLLPRNAGHASFGRELELAALEQIILGPLPARIMMHGIFGIGRTQVLLELAASSAVRDRFEERIAYISLRGAATANLEISSFFELADTGHPHDKPVLLLIDDLDEPWRADPTQTAAQLEQLAAMLPAAAIVATARGSWEAQDCFPDAIELGPLAQAAAMEMLQELVPGLAHTDNLSWLVDRLDRIPLAIALVAEDARRDTNPGALRDAFLLTDTSRVRSLRWSRAIASSVEQALATVRPRDPATTLFAMMGLLGGPVREQDLDELLDQGILAGQGLTSAGLVRRLGDRLELMEPLRSVASLREPKMDRAWRFFLKRAEILGDRVGRKGSGDVIVGELSADLANVETALIGALRSGDTEAVRSALPGLGRFYQLELPKTLDTLTIAADEARKGRPPDVEAAVRKVLGEVALNLERADLAFTAFKRAKELFDSVEDEKGSAQVRLRLAELKFRQNKPVEAEIEFQTVAELFAKQGDRGREAIARQRLGEIALRRGRLDNAEACFQDAYILYQRAHDAIGQSNCSQFLGNLVLARQDRRASDDEFARSELAMAQLYFEAARRTAREVGDDLAMANAIFGLGRVISRSGNSDAAVSLWLEAERCYLKAGDVLGQANCIRQRAILDHKTGKVKEAIEGLRAALAMYDAIDRPRSAASCAATLARIYIDPENKNDARAAYALARDRFIKGNDISAAGQMTEQLARLANGDAERAELEKQAASLLEQADRHDLTLDL